MHSSTLEYPPGSSVSICIVIWNILNDVIVLSTVCNNGSCFLHHHHDSMHKVGKDDACNSTRNGSCSVLEGECTTLLSLTSVAMCSVQSKESITIIPLPSFMPIL
eukprot:3150607-Ditylum_brightwellii.AAC.1